MIIKGPVFLILIGIVFIYYTFQLSVPFKIKIIQLSNISVIILITIFAGIVYNVITGGLFFKESLIKDFGKKLVEVQESHGGFFGYYFFGSFIFLYPIYPIFILGVFFNFFKKINWDKNLILLFLTISIFFLILELIPTKLPHYILPVVPLMCIYLSRSLEFIEFKFTKILFVINIFVPVSLIFLDFISYEGLESLKFEGTGETRLRNTYLLYFFISINMFLNPIFYKSNQSVLNIVKISSLSSCILILLTVINLAFLHKNIWIAESIKSFIANNDRCSNDYYVEISGINEPSLIFEFYEKFKEKSNCIIKIKSSDINNLPIENIDSTNRTLFNYSNGKKINLNLSIK